MMELITQDGSNDEYSAKMPEFISPSEPFLPDILNEAVYS